MKQILILAFCLIFVGGHSQARDYMVDVVSENYREKAADSYGEGKRVFHTIQINSDLGSRLLILNGDDFQYRNWLRAYLSQGNRLIVKVSDADDHAFRMARAYALDVTQVYPIDEKQWKPDEIGTISLPAFTGKRHVLIVDANEKRRELINLIVKDLGYPVTVSANGTDALLMFRMQPGKFRMVIADSTLPGLSGAQLVKNLIHTEPDLPVILGTTYGDRTMKEIASTLFAGSDSVLVKPVVLQELPKTILSMLKDRA